MFETQYHCNSLAMCGKSSVAEDGDKILLPPSALRQLAHMNVEWPMLFRISNTDLGRSTHCGVLEFTSEEGRCYLPYWMMQNLLLEEGALIIITNVSLRKATYAKFRAQSVDFLDISNHRAVLEVTLRKYTCLTVGDIIKIRYADQDYGLEITELKPGNAVSIIETDMNTEFDEPVGYKESKYAAHERDREKEGEATAATAAQRTLQKAKVVAEGEESGSKFVPFGGAAQRVDGKAIKRAPGDEKADSNGNGASAPAPAPAGEKDDVSPSSDDAGASVFQRKSIIGNKYAKKKNKTSAFGGTGFSLEK